MSALTTRQVELLMFFAYDRPLSSARTQTCDALVARGLICRDQDSPVYRITDLGREVAASLDLTAQAWV